MNTSEMFMVILYCVSRIKTQGPTEAPKNNDPAPNYGF